MLPKSFCISFFFMIILMFSACSEEKAFLGNELALNKESFSPLIPKDECGYWQAQYSHTIDRNCISDEDCKAFTGDCWRGIDSCYFAANRSFDQSLLEPIIDKLLASNCSKGMLIGTIKALF